MSIAPSLLAACRRLITSRPAEDVQLVGDLTVERRITATGAWWVWRDSGGQQVHAGLAPDRQFVAGNHYVLDTDGFWRRETGLEPGAARGDAADPTLAGHQCPAPQKKGGPS